ncbi:unnamed protein product [Clonostachys chloroleuca]|uniref:sterol 3beta-glucosyltransferase n=1 Tax=Clonostachys chloroleuca TaxID=1926264 RepID=A0AA35M8M8_9HYPO|nr:unnamed protein product [Clonostachys chloroleuca]
MESHPRSPPHSPARALSNDLQRRLSRRLKKKHQHECGVEIPERLRDSDHSDGEDQQSGQSPPMFMNMNQSIFGLIAAAGSRVDFHERFNDSSSDEDGEDGSGHAQGVEEDLSRTTILTTPKPKERRSHRRKLSAHRLLRSLPALPKLKSKSQSLPTKLSTPREDPQETESLDKEKSNLSVPTNIDLDIENLNRRPPVMSRMLEARAEMSSRPSFDLDTDDMGTSQAEEPSDSSPLAKRLMDIFEFEEPEQVIEEYPCWLLQSVLLQGFLYITTKHICFYAYLPKKANVVSKSGFLSKSGKRNPKYNRYWCRLKGYVLSYHQDSTNPYFPHGQIDLSYAISASVTDSDKKGIHFSVVTPHRTYNFRADSAPSAKEWVKSLQRVIFRSHNDGDSVKISLPIDNVIDVEDTQMIEFADTCKIRVIDNDETYAIDEYFFSFFSFGEEAIGVLRLLVEESASRARNKEKMSSPVPTSPGDLQSGHTSPSNVPDHMMMSQIRIPRPSENVRATLSPMSPQSATSPRESLDVSRGSSFEGFRHRGRRSFDLPSAMPGDGQMGLSSSSRRSLSRRRWEDNKTPRQHESSDSYVQSSVEAPSFSNIGSSAAEDPALSASQILRDSHVFHPDSHRLPPQFVSREAGSKEKHAANEDESKSGVPSSSQAVSTDQHLELNASGDQNQSSPTLQSISKIGSYPLQRAGAFAEYLNKTRQKMSSLLATESMGYVEKVSGMWRGGTKHFDAPKGLRIDDDDIEEDSDGNKHTSNERFRAHFTLPESEQLQATYFCYLFRVLPLYGKIYLSDRSFCFRSLLPGTRTKLILPLQDIETVHKEKGFRFGYNGLVVVIKGHEELFFEFGQAEHRDDCNVTLLQSLETTRYLEQEGLLPQYEEDEDDGAIGERDALRMARRGEFPDHELRLPRRASGISNAPFIIDESETSIIDFRPKTSMKITCLTIGSRGDVQPYIALCKGLLAQGHKPRIATHAEFQGWIESHGIEFARVEGDPGELMRLCIENGTFTWSFLREANATFRGWLDELLVSAVGACEGSDLLIESPSAMAGIHIAEKLGIPYFRAFTMPWTRTRAYPHAFIMPEHKMGGAYNYMTYIMFDNLFWKAISHQVNRWRNNMLGLPNTSLEKMAPNKVPFIYNFSPMVVAPPLDFSDWIRVTGYWFLDEGDKYEPPPELKAFIQKARDDNKKLVYVGFGSIIVNDPPKMTQEVIDAVLKADVRCILSKGWSDRISSKVPQSEIAQLGPEPEIPPEIHVIKSAPHDWLFQQIDAAAHHGGSGTTGASLRAGIPTIIRPFFGDQFFFASRVEDLGVGVWVKKWGTNAFGRALWEATRSERMIVRARVLGEQIRQERGVDLAIQSIYRDMEYAKSLVRRKAGRNQTGTDEQSGGNELDEDEESWTFVNGDEPDPDFVTKKLSEGFAGLAGFGNGSLRATS